MKKKPAGKPKKGAIAWKAIGKFEDILYHKAEGIAKLTINRPEVR